MAYSLRGHGVVRTGDLGWQSLENDVLLNAAEKEGFDLLVTCDQSIPMQQNLTGRKIALVVLSTNHWPTLRPVAAQIAIKIEFAQPGQLLRINIDEL